MTDIIKDNELEFLKRQERRKWEQRSGIPKGIKANWIKPVKVIHTPTHIINVFDWC